MSTVNPLSTPAGTLQVQSTPPTAKQVGTNPDSTVDKQTNRIEQEAQLDLTKKLDKTA